ncbi:MAG TPA: FAD-dependent oxidoreductase [Limnobacter sp.]|uniref:flavin monoamine oxidase family protein n=1 Tax=Limnobacter sp. TaxID=2003368 RepID=UPI002E2F0D84|nr:FAD-dependent oxidoreductase [Limnobacter sp.]HEX5484947.1 FAD-dependent oxidoreductase [Limnobacter sp.]
MQHTTTIAILGGGLSGLYAAHLLQQQGISFTLFEARTRLGGRIHSTPRGFDLGPAWFWPEANPRVSQLVNEFGLSWFEQNSTGAALFEPAQGGVRKLPNSYPQYPVSCRLEGGMVSLVNALEHGLTPQSIRLQAQITSLTATQNGVEIAFTQEGQQHTCTAQKVISAMPLRLLSHSVRFQPELPQSNLKLLQGTPTWMAGQAKIVAEYSTAFWREQGLSGDAFSQRGPLVEIHDASGASGHPAALFGFVGGSAEARNRLGDEQLKALAVEQLGQLFGPAAANPLAVHYLEWGNDPLLSTASDLESTSQHPHYARRTLPQPWAELVSLAGTENSPEAGGYLEGALEAAQWAVQHIQRAIH